MISFFKKLYLSNEGATAIEYGLIVALVAIAAIAAFSGLADTTTNMWIDVATEVFENSSSAGP